MERPTCLCLPRTKLNFPDFKTESSISWEPSVPGKPGPVSHLRDGRGAIEWIVRNVHTIKMHNLHSQGNDPYLFMDLLRKTYSLLLCQYLLSGKVHTHMHQDETAVCS